MKTENLTRSNIAQRDYLFLKETGIPAGFVAPIPRQTWMVGMVRYWPPVILRYHLDDDHTNNDPGNLATICPFCHSVFHIGNCGEREAGIIIWNTELSQSKLNALMMAVFVGMYRKDSESKVERRNAGIAENLYYGVKSSSGMIEELFGEGASNPKKIGKALGALSRAQYARRAEILTGVRLLPNYKYYAKRHVPYWNDKVVGALHGETWEELWKDACTDA